MKVAQSQSGAAGSAEYKQCRRLGGALNWKKTMTVTHKDVKRHFPNATDHQVVEILDSGATESDLAEAAAQLAQEDDVMGELERPLTGRARLVYELLSQAEAAWDDNR